MSNPARAPRDAVGAPSLSLLPDCHLAFVYEVATKGSTTAWEDECARAKNLDAIVQALAVLDMEIAEPFVIPRELTVATEAFQSAKPFYARAKKGKVSFRLRTDVARDLLNPVFGKLPEDLRETVRGKAANLVLADGGTEFTMGRLLMAYPRKNSRILEPITRAEAKRAWREEVGVVLTDPLAFDAYVVEEERTRYPFYATVEGAPAVRVNRESGNGYPVLGKGSDEEATAKYLAMAESVREELEAAHTADPAQGIARWLRQAERERPYLVGLQGKAKGDYYTGEKVRELKLRFYNVMGRQMMLNIQTGSQRLEDLAESALDAVGNRSASGIALVRGGAAKLVRALDDQLALEEEGHVRMGDDSWVVMIIDGKLLMFALDCSNFDLTQHGDLTREVHWELREIGERIDAVAAQLLHAYQRTRLVVTAHRLAYLWKHGGPSGLPGQSKVNGTIMGVAISRATKGIRKLADNGTEITEESVGAVLKNVGDRMGIAIKLEQFSLTPLETTRAEENPVTETLRTVPFLFLGYYFYHEDGVVSVHADMPRAMSQMRYPNLKWVNSKQALRTTECARLGSTLLSLGRPTAALRPAFTTAWVLVDQMISKEIRENGDYRDSKLRWAVAQGAVLGDETEAANMASLSGVLGALRKGWDELWLPAPDLDLSAPTSPEDLPVVHTGGLPQLDLSVGAIVPPSRKPTLKTAGRNPNTKVFGPPQAPRNPMTRIHENAEWTRDRAGGATGPNEEEAQADAWAAERVALETEAARLREAQRVLEEDFYGSDAEEDRFGQVLDSEQAEEWQDEGRWRIA